MKKKPDAEKMKRQSFTCNEAEWNWILEHAKKHEMSTSAFIRKLIRLYIKRQSDP